MYININEEKYDFVRCSDNAIDFLKSFGKSSDWTFSILRKVEEMTHHLLEEDFNPYCARDLIAENIVKKDKKKLQYLKDLMVSGTKEKMIEFINSTPLEDLISSIYIAKVIAKYITLYIKTAKHFAKFLLPIIVYIREHDKSLDETMNDGFKLLDDIEKTIASEYSLKAVVRVYKKLKNNMQLIGDVEKAIAFELNEVFGLNQNISSHMHMLAAASLADLHIKPEGEEYDLLCVCYIIDELSSDRNNFSFEATLRTIRQHVQELKTVLDELEL